MLRDLINLTKQLYPTGRAFNIRTNGVFFKLSDSLAASEARVLSELRNLLSRVIPDNAVFDAEDAGHWERALGLPIAPEGVDLEGRKQIIYNKMKYPGTLKARQHYLYIEARLRENGFNVYILENDLSETPAAMNYGEFNYGEGVYGSAAIDWTVCANYTDETKDRVFNIGLPVNYRATFYVGGQNPGDFATVPAERKNEFRELILKLKPAQTVGLLRINYT